MCVDSESYTLKNTGLFHFNPNLGQIWTNPNVGLKMQLNNLQLKVAVEVGLKFEITFLTQHLGLSIFDPKLG